MEYLIYLAIGCTHSHSDALAQIRSVGIGISSSGGCSDRTNRKCTSLDQVRCNVIRCLKTLKTSSKCPMTVTGGTVRNMQKYFLSFEYLLNQ
jgi:hypothetical protein